jgi:alanyl-tRNA synthetase
MGSACVTLDLDKPLDAHQIALGERLANEAVYQNLPIEIGYPSAQELETLDYRSKKELTGQVRIVTIPGYDVCACCGTHVARTGEIGMVKVLGFMHYKGGVRISMLCGSRALRDYGERLAAVTAVSGLLSAKPEAVADAVERLLQEKDALKQQVSTLQNDLLAGNAASLQPAANGVLCTFVPKCARAAAVFSGEDGHFQYAVAGAEGIDVRAFGKEMNAALNGRGGGKPGLVQGNVQASRKEIEDWFAQHKED